VSSSRLCLVVIIPGAVLPLRPKAACYAILVACLLLLLLLADGGGLYATHNNPSPLYTVVSYKEGM